MRASVCLFLFVFAAGCGGGRSAIPLSETFTPKPDQSFVYAGNARAYRFAGGEWVEAPSYQYEFTVLQRRYSGRWETRKEIHRLHPGYSGLAGARDQTYHFVASLGKEADGKVPIKVEGSLGSGSGSTDPEFKDVVVELDAGTSFFAPYDSIRITQHYGYSAGLLVETVELYRKADGKEKPFMKMVEDAVIYLPANVHEPPR